MEYTLSIPAFDRAQLISGCQIAQALVSLIAFSVMAAASTSHDNHYQYSFYSSLSFFVLCGVVSFLFSFGIVAAKHLRVPQDLEVWGTGLMVWLTYSAAIAASATSANLHVIFDQDHGSVCRLRHNKHIKNSAYFCSHVVSAIFFMYVSCFLYVATLVLLILNGGDSSRRSWTSSLQLRNRHPPGPIYDEIDTCDHDDEAPPQSS